MRKVLAVVLAQIAENDWIGVADYMNAKGAAFQKLGLKIGFHNHNAEFGPVIGGKGSIIGSLIARTDPALVSFQLDWGCAISAGVDPAAFLRKH